MAFIPGSGQPPKRPRWTSLVPKAKKPTFTWPLLPRRAQPLPESAREPGPVEPFPAETQRMYGVRRGWRLYSGLLAAGAIFLLFAASSFGVAVWLLGWVPVATGASRLFRRRDRTWFGTSTSGGAVLLVVSGMAIGVIGIVAMPRNAVPASPSSTAVKPFVSVGSPSTAQTPPLASPSPAQVSSIAEASASTSTPSDSPVGAQVPAQSPVVAPSTTAPRKTTATAAAPAPAPAKTTSQPASVYYANCAAARAAGAAPLHRGDPGYRVGLDRDGDGIACE